ncbi:MAG: efflux RND transporter periplasmic adaptor subunit [Parvibaculum sp.]|nr:efflux RND transporter periplasmic adaptor subunit [Parvibaculum sp.]
MNRLNNRWVYVVGGLLLLTVFLFRGSLGLGGAQNAKGEQASPVTAAIAQINDVPVYTQTIGTVMANATVQVRPRADGQIVAVRFREGQIVKAGDLLFEIDRAPYEAALRAAQANLQRDEAQLGNASRDLGRANELSKKGYASAQTRDTASASKKSLAAGVAAAQAAVDQAQLQLGYTEIRSPINGKTGPILVDAGNIVQAASSTPLVTVTQIQPVKISFSLAQQNLPQLQEQMKAGTLVAAIHVQSTPGVPPKADAIAPVDFIGNTVNTSTGTIELRATYDNPDLSFVPGEFVDVNVRLVELKSAVTIPREAVNTGQKGLYVFVIGKDNKVEMRTVTLAYQNNEIAAIKEGLNAGERVVTDGQLRLLPNTLVKIVEDDKGQPQP